MSRFEVKELPFSGLKVVERKKITDVRGSFERLFCLEEFNLDGVKISPLQINHSFTRKRGTIRGLHFQLPPYSEIKLVTCLVGSIWDVVVDLRFGSPTYLQWYSIELSQENNKAIYIPEGFAHGFQATVDNVHLLYLHSQKYNAEFERGLNPLDKKLDIKWPVFEKIISDRDASHQMIGNGDLYAL